MSNYKAVIGLEMHCELKSNSKVFSKGKNDYSSLANSNVSLVDMAFPGTLPNLNKKCVYDAIKMAIAFNCKIAPFMMFDRKNYYYPDLPKGYQITQFTEPVGTNGYVMIGDKKVFIHDIHLEEDSASMDHYSNHSVIDYNRAGVPLLELVTEPCINSAEEALAFLETIRSMYQYAEVSDADTKKGQIRCDVNVSIMDENDTKLGTRVEVKNVNSFSNVVDCINYEIERQSKLKEEGRYEEVVQETRRFDEETGTTVRMRSKEDAIDYKYFVEPNLPKFKITEDLINTLRNKIPAFKEERKNNYINKYNLSDTEANTLVKEKNISDYFEECINIGIDPKEACNWICVNIIGYINKEYLNISDIYLKPNMLKEIIDNVKKGVISSKQAKEIFNKVLEEQKNPSEFIKGDNLQISDEAELENVIDDILNNNESQINDYKNGKTNLFDYFVGQVMKNTRGKANPVKTKEILHKKLD